MRGGLLPGPRPSAQIEGAVSEEYDEKGQGGGQEFKIVSLLAQAGTRHFQIDILPWWSSSNTDRN